MKNNRRMIYILATVVTCILLLVTVMLLPPFSTADAGYGDCIAYDTFTRGNGAIGSTETTGPSSEACTSYAWTGGAISGNKNLITPSEGATLWDAAAGIFTSDTYA